MQVLVYEGRGGGYYVTAKSRENWDSILLMMEQENGMSIDEARQEGFCVDGGTYEEGHVSVDDGGRIFTSTLFLDILLEQT